MDIYSNRDTLKWIIVAVALLIGAFTLMYTRQLVQDLRERELREIYLFAKGIEVAASPERSDNMNFLITEILGENHSVPVILTSENGIPQQHRNMNMPNDLTAEEQQELLLREIKIMEQEYKPIEINLDHDWKQYVYYEHSPLITRLQYYPLVQLAGVTIFATLAYLVFRSTRRAEQNKIWVGLAKETAHQLGTPISSLIAWLEYFKTDPNFDKSIIAEMNKDVKRLEMITARFSNIGSVTTTKVKDVEKVITNIVVYLQKRISSKIQIKVVSKFGQKLVAGLNVPLFEWVIENLCKNAADAIEDSGRIEIYIKNTKDNKMVMIDVHDTGNGIHAATLKSIFQPGFTTKKRGWGLGLTLVKRIIEEYHHGKIFVRKSEVGKGTTFRILLPKVEYLPHKATFSK